MKKLALGLAALLAVAVIGILVSRKLTPPLQQAQEPLISKVAPVVSQKSVASVVPAQQIQSREASKLPSLTDPSAKSSEPTIEKVRSEVAANPDETPRTLIVFASRMSKFMTAALSSPEVAPEAATQLEQCVLNKSSGWIDTARALCLANFERLADANPSLKGRLVAAQKSADPRIVSLVDAMNRLAH